MADWRVIEGDCVEQMAAMAETSVDAVVCDPPYLLTFMGRTWDHAPSPAEGQAMHRRWAGQAFRVLKPGGHLLAFGGTRTYHRLACAIEDAGFEIRDTIAWMYGSGFPKSLDVSKAIDAAAGAEREDVYEDKPGVTDNTAYGSGLGVRLIERRPATPDAERWQGWGTALKPAHEPVVVARKPLAGTVAANVLAHGTGALNVDGCRIGTPDDKRAAGTRRYAPGTLAGGTNMQGEVVDAPHDGLGRWPANVVLDPESARALDEQTADTVHGAGQARDASDGTHSGGQGVVGFTHGAPAMRFGDSGGASRFFGVFDHQEDPWTNDCVRSAGESSSQSDALTDSVDGLAPGALLPEHEDSGPPSSASVSSAGKPSSTTRATGRGTTAPTPAGPPQSEPSDPIASDAADPSDSCATGSAPSSARPSPSSACDRPEPHGRPSGQQPSAPTPYRFRASTVEPPDGTGIMSSTTIPPSSCGSASPATPLDMLDVDGRGPTRFRYEPKSSSAERNAGLDGFEAQGVHRYGAGIGEGIDPNAPSIDRNVHPTVKPIALMCWLVRLVTAPGGLVLDPFAGSGTTGAAAVLEGFRFVGIEREAEYAAIARARIAWWSQHPDGMELVKRLEAEKQHRAIMDAGQLGLFG